MLESDSCQPKPNGPLPKPESYAKLSFGPKPERPGGVATGTLKLAVPVAGFAEKLSPMPRSAPPPLGSEIVGAPLACCVSGSAGAVSGTRSGRHERAPVDLYGCGHDGSEKRPWIGGVQRQLVRRHEEQVEIERHLGEDPDHIAPAQPARQLRPLDDYEVEITVVAQLRLRVGAERVD